MNNTEWTDDNSPSDPEPINGVNGKVSSAVWIRAVRSSILRAPTKTYAGVAQR